MVVCILLTLDLECGTIFIQGYLDPESKINKQAFCFCFGILKVHTDKKV